MGSGTVSTIAGTTIGVGIVLTSTELAVVSTRLIFLIKTCRTWIVIFKQANHLVDQGLNSEEAEHYRNWVGPGFDAERFDLRAANVTLLRTASNRWGNR